METVFRFARNDMALSPFNKNMKIAGVVIYIILIMFGVILILDVFMPRSGESRSNSRLIRIVPGSVFVISGLVMRHLLTRRQHK
jgi:hypothetical protein